MLKPNLFNTKEYLKFEQDIQKKKVKKFVVRSKNRDLAILYYTLTEGILKSFRYGGIITNSRKKAFIEYVKKEFIEHCKSKGIKRYSIRNNPFLNTIKIGKVVRKEPFVFIDLTRSEEQLNKGISKNHHKSIRKAEKEDLKVFETEDPRYLKTFYNLYKDQFKLKNMAPQKYSFFKKIFFYLNKNLSFAYVKDKDEIIAMSIILKDKPNIFMMYGGMNKKAYLKCAKHLLIYNLIFAYKDKGYLRLILGTGNKEKDSIYKFKKSFTDKESYIYTYGGKI